MDKTQLREIGIQQLKKIASNPKKKQQKEEMILHLFFASRLWKEASTIGLIRSTEIEFNTQPIIERALQEGKTVAVPKSLSGGQLAFYAVDDRTAYRTSDFGVEEPVSNEYLSKEEINLLVVPGLIFSHKGYRIGYGGGYYDRYLADFEGKTCSLVFSEQLNNDWDALTFDQPVARIYTDYMKEVVSHG